MVTMDSLAYGGDAVGHIGDKVIFVHGGVPGDVARVNILQDKGSYLRGIMEELLIPSPARVEPFCPLAIRCGGCQWQEIAYTEQLRWKKTIVEESFRRIGGIDTADVEDCQPSPIEQGFRSIVRYPSKMTADGLVFGYYERRSHNIVGFDRCPAACERVNTIAAYIKRLFSDSLSTFDIREITIQSSYNNTSSLITFTTAGYDDMSDAARRMLSDIPGLAGVIHHTVHGRHMHIYGEQFRFEVINGNRFRIGESSFFQTNIPQTERLVSLAGSMLSCEPSDTMVDGYGGVGLFSLNTAPSEAKIHLYDLTESAVNDSIFNARELGFNHFTAHRKDTLSAAAAIGHADILILDPPRPGLGTKTVKAVSTLNARTIVYVSCNPTTLARDVKLFREEGYVIGRIVPVDMFPQTYHIETVVKLMKA